MILRFIKPVFFILLLSNCNYSFAEINAEHESELLYTTLKFNDIMEKNLHVYVDQSLKRNPIAVKYKNRVISFYRKHVGPESLKPYVIDIMIEMFTAQELKKLNTFYASPTGNKSLKLMFPKSISTIFMNHFIRGYFDGDGSISFSRKGASPLCIWRSKLE